MSRKQAVVIIGLLAAMLIGVAIVAGPGQSSGQNEVHLPIVAGDGAVQASSVITELSDIQASVLFTDGDVVAGIHPQLGVYAGMPSTDADDQATINATLSRALEKVQGNLSEEEIRNLVEPATGETTAGSVIVIAGKDIQLPPNVQIEAFSIEHFCPPPLKCLEAPAYALIDDEGHRIALSAVTGGIGDPGLSADVIEEQKSHYGWLIEAVGDPIEPTVVPTAIPAEVTP